MENALISVVIPVYNRETLITDALDSVFRQSYRPLEVIVVDDGSTDRTADVVRQWIAAHSDSPPNLFTTRLYSQENMGGNVARNRGIKESSGKLIAFLDSDDIWLPDKLDKQAELFEEEDIGGVYCGVQHVNVSSGKVIAPFNRNYPTGWILDQLLVKDVTAPTSTFILRREVFEKVGPFDITLQARQDWDMWIRLTSKYKIQAVPEPLVQYREHSGLRTASDPAKEIRAYISIRKKYAGLLKQQSSARKRAANAAFYKRLGRVHFHHGISTIKATRFYLLSLLNKPDDFDTWAALFGLFLPRNLRERLHLSWNRIFGATSFAIRSH